MLAGAGGEDGLSGEDGDDVLIGGTGRDLLTGGAGADIFRFFLGDLAREAPNADRITDFTHGVDLIDLGGIDAVAGTAELDPFRLIGAAAFTGRAGELRVSSGGQDTLISGDTDGDRVADFVLRLTGAHTVTEADFLLVG